jgi:hypothetical protein
MQKNRLGRHRGLQHSWALRFYDVAVGGSGCLKESTEFGLDPMGAEKGTEIRTSQKVRLSPTDLPYPARNVSAFDRSFERLRTLSRTHHTG